MRVGRRSSVVGSKLVLDRVSKIYPNGVKALERFSAEVRVGEVVAIIGGSGCGKSTLLRAIAGLDRATSGTVTLDGTVVLAPHAKIGIVFQEPRLLPWLSVAGNIGFGLSDQPSAVRREAAALQLFRVRPCVQGLSREGGRNIDLGHAGGKLPGGSRHEALNAAPRNPARFAKSSRID